MNNGIYASFIISGTTDISEEAGLFFSAFMTNVKFGNNF